MSTFSYSISQTSICVPCILQTNFIFILTGSQMIKKGKIHISNSKVARRSRPGIGTWAYMMGGGGGIICEII